MNIDSNKYNFLLTNLEVELVVRLQNYVEFLGLSYLVAVWDLRDVKSLKSQCLHTLGKENITFPSSFPTEMVVEEGARKAMWLFRQCDFTPLEQRLKVRSEEERALCELVKTYRVYKQIQDLK